MKVRTFSEVEAELGEKRGWRQGSGDEVLVNPKLGVVRHVAICRDDGTPLYDQFLHIEPIGAITVPVNTKGELGVVTVERPGVRDMKWYQFPGGPDLSLLGCPSMEFPRGFPKKGELAAQTAAREGEEELGSPILSVQQIGEITPNTTFHPHRIPVFLVRVNEAFAGTMPPDVNEKILKVEWRSLEDVMSRIRGSKIHCGMTKAALCHYLAEMHSEEYLPRDRTLAGT